MEDLNVSIMKKITADSEPLSLETTALLTFLDFADILIYDVTSSPI